MKYQINSITPVRANIYDIISPPVSYAISVDFILDDDTLFMHMDYLYAPQGAFNPQKALNNVTLRLWSAK